MEVVREDTAMLSEDVMMGDGGGDARLAREGHVGGGCSGLAHTSCGCPGERATAAKSMEEQIRLINSNQALSMSDKARAIQMLYNQAWMRPRGGDTCVEQPSRHALPRGEFSASERAPCYTDSSRETLGCEHYPRKCKLEAACCGRLYCCRFCHDEAEDHQIDRFATERVWCMVCSSLQPAEESCQGCGVQFAAYFCRTCRFYDDTPGKKIYHCDKCGICRVGEGVGIDNVHCDKCNACVAIESMDRHHCLERSLEVNCPICSGFLFTSVLPVVFMRCGHTMHTHCFEEYTKTNYTCPLCSKALSDMSSFYRRLDEVLANEKLPEEYANRMSHILCNDCGRKSDARFHFMYHKCENCNGYNTRVLQTFVAGT
mmetsp:Transcript_6045/g.12819  ORF Transcript_6045/g.12819 Transcript_6045/m.12819 type:complete len:372 (+) Transcript_6045:783-1898(+)